MTLLPPQLACALPLAWAAILAFATGSRAEPSDRDVVSQAFQLRMDTRYHEAARLLEKEVKDRPGDDRAWFELARLRFHLVGESQNLDSSQEAIENAIAAAPESALYHCWATRIALFKGILKAHDNDEEGIAAQFGKAATAGEKAVALDPDDHRARRMLTSLYGNNPAHLHGDRKRGERHVAELEERSPIDGVSARCEFTKGLSDEERLALWNALAREHRDNSRYHRHLAGEYARAGKIAEAEKHAGEALKLDPQDARVLLELCRTLALQGKLDPAEKFAQRYLAHDPPAPRSLRAWGTFALAKIRQMTERKEAAEQTLAEAKKLDPRFWQTMTPPPAELFLPPPPPTR